MNFLVDNQLPLAPRVSFNVSSRTIRRTVAEGGLREASDAEVWRYASMNELVLFSKDEDFANMVLKRPTAKLVWVRVGNCRRMPLLDLFRRVWPGVIKRLQSGDSFIEIR